MTKSLFGTAKIKLLTSLATIGLLSACGTTGIPTMGTAGQADPAGFDDMQDVPQSLASRVSGNTYIPTDPLSVNADSYAKCATSSKLLEVFPDNAVRIAIKDISGDGSLSFLGGSSIGAAGRSYRIVIDYINADTANQSLGVGKYTQSATGTRNYIPLFNKTEDEDVYFDVNRSSFRDDLLNVLADECTTNPSTDGCNMVRPSGNRVAFEEEVNVPVYVGVGIRVTINLTVLSGNVELSGLGAISAAAEANKVSGNLIIQTLGITGSKVTSTLPLPSELNPTTIQNAIMAMATIKSALYSDAGDVKITPRVVGFYDPLGFGNQQYVNAMVTELSKEAVDWSPNCTGD